jgi:hypothetical protein
MEWGDRAKASAAAAAAAADERAGGGGEGLGGYVKVMTDEQMEVLRKQISIYATICEQLVEMHRTLTEHQDSIAGRSPHLPPRQLLLPSLAALCFSLRRLCIMVMGIIFASSLALWLVRVPCFTCLSGKEYFCSHFCHRLL